MFHSCKPHYLYFRLRDQILLQPVVGQAGVSSLSVLAAGPKAPWPTCLLCNPRLGEAWRGCDLPDISFDSSSSCFAVFFLSVFLFLFVFGGAVVFFFFFPWINALIWFSSQSHRTCAGTTEGAAGISRGSGGCTQQPLFWKKNTLKASVTVSSEVPSFSLSFTGFLLLWIFLPLLLHAFFPPYNMLFQLCQYSSAISLVVCLLLQHLRKKERRKSLCRLLAENWELTLGWASPGFKKAKRIISFLTKEFWLGSLLADSATHAELTVPTPGPFPSLQSEKVEFAKQAFPVFAAFTFSTLGLDLQDCVHQHIVWWSWRY